MTEVGDLGIICEIALQVMYVIVYWQCTIDSEVTVVGKSKLVFKRVEAD